jgi:DNA-binding response OmpR family regulator
LRAATMTTKSDPAPKRQVLVADSDSALRSSLRLHLTASGFDVTDVGDGKRALDIALGMRFDVLVLDAGLPGVDGIALCQALRADGANTETPILVTAAPGEDLERLLGPDIGADDYVHRPFMMRELVARAHALVRRASRVFDNSARPGAGRVVQSRDVTLDPDRRQVVVRGAVIDLTRQEFDLIYLLACRPGIVFSRAALMARVWNGDTYVTERTVDTVVSRLRKKVEIDPQNPRLVLTAWGVGYKFIDTD